MVSWLGFFFSDYQKRTTLEGLGCLLADACTVGGWFCLLGWLGDADVKTNPGKSLEALLFMSPSVGFAFLPNHEYQLDALSYAPSEPCLQSPTA